MLIVTATSRYLILTAIACICCSCSAPSETAVEAWNRLAEPVAKKPAFTFVHNDPGLPNVLIYGDSISIGYTTRVRQHLKGKANVYRIHTNGEDSASFIPKMKALNETMHGYWSFDWDVIHFNVGLHDLKYVLNDKLDKINGDPNNSTTEYEKNIRDILAYLKRLSPDAKLIFATTTPVPNNAPWGYASDVIKYNQVALGVLDIYPEIIVNDLYAFTFPNQAVWAKRPEDVHYNSAGYKALGDEVARVILKVLEDKDRSHN